MPLAVGDNLAHMREILLVIPSRILCRVLLQDLDDLAATEDTFSGMLMIAGC